MTGFWVGWSESNGKSKCEKQIPFGNDRKKGKGNCNCNRKGNRNCKGNCSCNYQYGAFPLQGQG